MKEHLVIVAFKRGMCAISLYFAIWKTMIEKAFSNPIDYFGTVLLVLLLSL